MRDREPVFVVSAIQYLNFSRKFPPGIFLTQKKRDHVFHTISLFDLPGWRTSEAS